MGKELDLGSGVETGCSWGTKGEPGSMGLGHEGLLLVWGTQVGGWDRVHGVWAGGPVDAQP